MAVDNFFWRFADVGPRPEPLPPAMPQTTFTGTSGNDTFSGGNGDDIFNMASGGDDTVSGKAGDDVFNFGAALTAADTIDGGKGADDVVTLTGTYTGSHALTFGATTMKNVEELDLSSGKFDLTMNDANVASGETLLVNANTLHGSQSLAFDASAERNGNVTVVAGSSAAVLTGSAGTDAFIFAGGFKASDRIDGGAGGDTLSLNGDYSAGLTFLPGTLKNIESLVLGGGHSYSLTLDNANVAFKQSFSVNGNALGASDSLAFDGSAETSARLGIAGGAGDDILIGGGAADKITTGAGTDIVVAGGGDDTINAGASLDASDAIDGGDGNDTLSLTGNYLLTFGANTIQNIERIQLTAGGDYSLTLGAKNVASGATLTIDGSALGAPDVLTLDGSVFAPDRFINVQGGAGADVITIGQSGRDIVNGGAGDDVINALGNLTESSRIDGGTGSNDHLVLNGDYSDRLQFLSTTMKNIESIQLTLGHSYNLALADGNVAAGATLSVFGNTLGAGDKLTFDASVESNGNVFVGGGAGNDHIIGGAGNDVLGGGGGNDTIDASHGGTDVVAAGDGDDTIVFGAALDNTDTVDPGNGNDTLLLDGDYSGAAVKLPTVDNIVLATGHDYNFSIASKLSTLAHIHAQHLGPGDVLTLDGTASQGTLDVTGGAGDDTIVGGSSQDLIVGGRGDDILNGRAGVDFIDVGKGGNDIVAFTAVGDSTSINFDSVANFNFDEDHIEAPAGGVLTTHVVNSGQLDDTSQSTFDTELHAAVSGSLGANDADLFTADSGDLTGATFVVVDENGVAGYQSGADLVFEVLGFSGAFDRNDFI